MSGTQLLSKIAHKDHYGRRKWKQYIWSHRRHWCRCLMSMPFRCIGPSMDTAELPFNFVRRWLHIQYTIQFALRGHDASHRIHNFVFVVLPSQISIIVAALSRSQSFSFYAIRIFLASIKNHAIKCATFFTSYAHNRQQKENKKQKQN